MQVIDVLNDAGGRELLLNKYGLRRVPVLAKGDQYAIGQMIEPFAKLAGISLDTTNRLTPEQLYRKYGVIFTTAQRFARQFSREQLQELVIPNRPRVIRTLCYHVFRIGEAFLEAWEGAEYSQGIAGRRPRRRPCRTADAIARYRCGRLGPATSPGGRGLRRQEAHPRCSRRITAIPVRIGCSNVACGTPPSTADNWRRCWNAWESHPIDR